MRRSYICNEDSGLWYPTVCNFLLCVNITSHFISFIFVYHVLECEWLTGLVRIHPSWCPYLKSVKHFKYCSGVIFYSMFISLMFCYISCLRKVLLKCQCYIWILRSISPYVILLYIWVSVSG